MKKFLFDCGTRDLTASIGILALRVAVGLMMMLAHGIPKLKNYEVLRDKFQAPSSLDFLSGPVALFLTIGAEVGAAALLIVGLATRPAAFIFAFTMVIAAFDVHASDPFAKKELALMYLIPAVAILFSGAGSLSLDATLYKEGKRRRW